MTVQEVQALADLIAQYYPCFPKPSSLQLSLWAADLAAYEVPSVEEALRRWVRWHHAQPPQLGDLLHAVKGVVAESVRWRSTAEALPLERSDDQNLLLRHMSRLQQCLLGSWEDVNGQIHGRLTMRQAALMCRRWSMRYQERPQLANDFAQLASSYDAMAEADAAHPA